MSRAVKNLSLTKGAQRFCVVYEVGDEDIVLDAIIAMAHRPDLHFDWFDASVLSLQVGKHLAEELKSDGEVTAPPPDPGVG